MYGLPEVLRDEGKPSRQRRWHMREWPKANRRSAKASDPARAIGSAPFRGYLRGRMGRWREAAADLSKVVDLRPHDYLCFFLATVLVEGGDLEAYRAYALDPGAVWRYGLSEVANMLARACLMVSSPDPWICHRQPAG